MPTNSDLKFDEERINKLENKVTAINMATLSIKEDIKEIRVSQKENRDDISTVKEMAIIQQENQKNFKEDMEYLKQSIDKITNQMANDAKNSFFKKIGENIVYASVVVGMIGAVLLFLKYKMNLF